MVRLATADRPDVLCLQEVPLWALRRLARWSGMTVRYVVTRRSLLPARPRRRDHAAPQRPLPLGARRPGERDPARARARGARAPERCASTSGRREPRLCHAVRLAGPRRREPARDERLRRPEVPAAEIVRAEAFVTERRRTGLPCVLAGDFNVRAEHLRELRRLVGARPRDRPRARPRPRRDAARPPGRSSGASSTAPSSPTTRRSR